MKVGLWSLDWVDRKKVAAVGGAVKTSSTPIFSSSHCAPSVTKKKGGGYLRICARNLKRIVRLSDKDRKEVLRVLRKNERKRKRGCLLHLRYW